MFTQAVGVLLSQLIIRRRELPFAFSVKDIRMGCFNGCGNTAFVMLQGILGAFGVRLPVSWLMNRQVPVSLFHIGLATPASTIVQIMLCGIYFSIVSRRQNQSMKQSEQSHIADTAGS